MEKQNNKHKRGFASLSPERRAEIASLGGKKVQAMGKGHKWSPETAKKASDVAKRNRKSKI